MEHVAIHQGPKAERVKREEEVKLKIRAASDDTKDSKDSIIHGEGKTVHSS